MRLFPEADAPQPPLHDLAQRRYELIRPIVLAQNRTITQRARETGVHPATIGRLKRRFDRQGMRGLVPESRAIGPARRRARVPEVVVQELQRLKGLYDGFGDRELARIVFHTTTHRITGQTAKRLWDHLPLAPPRQLPLLDYHSYPERTQARLDVITLYGQGWSKRSISGCLRVSRPTIDRWIARFEAADLASLEDQPPPRRPVARPGCR